MKVVVIGGTGLMGSKVVAKLNDHGHAAIAASPEPGVNTRTGEGLADALTGAQVVVDVATAVAHTAISQPVGGILEVAGPDRYPLDDLVRTRLRASNDAASSRIRERATSEWCSMTRCWFLPPPRRCSPPVSRTGSSTTRPLRSGSTSTQSRIDHDCNFRSQYVRIG